MNYKKGNYNTQHSMLNNQCSREMTRVLTSHLLLPTSYFLLLTSYFLLPTSYFSLLTSHLLSPTSFYSSSTNTCPFSTASLALTLIRLMVESVVIVMLFSIFIATRISIL